MYILVIIMSWFVCCSQLATAIREGECQFHSCFEKSNYQLIRSGIWGQKYSFTTHLKVVASATSSNNSLLCFHSIYHAEEVNVGVTLLCSTITKCPLYPVVVLYVCMYVCMYVRMYVCMYVCMYVHMYVCMYVCMYVNRSEGGFK